jgi:predicted ATP-dependent Lon-type protease
MRKVSLASEVGKHVEFSSEFKIGDEKVLKKVMSGLIKLLFPDEQFDNSELKQVAELALEYRLRVRDWLHKLRFQIIRFVREYYFYRRFLPHLEWGRPNEVREKVYSILCKSREVPGNAELSLRTSR